MTDMTTESAPEVTEAAPETTAEVAERPEYLPEKFWNAESNAPNIEGLAKSYSELEKKFSQRASALKEELMSERPEGVPDSADGYEFKMPEIPNVPEGWDISMEGDDPLLNWWKDTAHSRGLTQDEFQDGINRYFEINFGGLPDREGELQQLGDNAQARIDKVDMWLNKNLDENEYNAIADFAVTADAIQVLEKIIGIEQSEPSLSGFGEEPSTGNVSEDKLRAMMDDPRYWKPGEVDDAYRQQVTEAWQKHYG